MKKIICLLAAFLLMGCTFGSTEHPDEASDDKEKMLQREEYLEKALDERLNEAYPDGYDAIAHGKISTVYMNDVGAVDAISRVIRVHKTNESNMVWFGSNRDNTKTEAGYEYFYDYLDKEEWVRTVAEFYYPEITSNHVYMAFGLSSEKREDGRLRLCIALKEEELNDRQIMEELVYILQHLDGVVVLKTDGTEDKETIRMKMLCYMAGEDALKEYRSDIANPLCEDFVSIPAGSTYFYDSDYAVQDASDITAESLETYLRQEWHRAC